MTDDAAPTDRDPQASRQERRRAADRVEQMLDIADRQVNALRSAGVSMNAVGEEAGVSRALVFAYFPDLYRLLDAVLARHVAALRAAGIERAGARGEALERVRAVADIYLRHSAAHGAALEYVLREPGIARRLDGRVSAFRGGLLRRVGRALARDLDLPSRDALVLAQLLEVIPGEAGRLAYEGLVTLDEAVELNARMVAACVDALRPR